MIPGTILFDENFKFSDNSTGSKLFVVLNDGACGEYICLKTTSNSAYNGIKYGCQNEDRRPTFYLPVGSCWFKKHTWIQLDQFFPFDYAELVNKCFSGTIIRQALLDGRIHIELLDCAISSYDISNEHRDILIDTLNVLRPYP